MNHHKIVSDFLYPVSPDDFVDNYWDVKPIHIKGDVEKLMRHFPTGLDRSRLLDLVALAGETKGFEFQATAFAKNVEVEGYEDEEIPRISITPNDTAELVSSGGNFLVSIPYLEQVDADLMRLLQGVIHGLGLVVRDGYTEFFCHPVSGDGIHLHYDNVPVFQIVLEGERQWKVGAKPLHNWPRSSSISRRDGDVNSSLDGWDEDVIHANSVELIDFLLTPGDVLYIPPGTLHTTKSGPSGSLALSLAFFSEPMTNIVAGVLADHFFHSENWRRPLPPNIRLGDGVALDAKSCSFIERRLDELRSFLNDLSSDSDLFVTTCQKTRARSQPHFTSSMHRSSGTEKDDRLKRTIGTYLAIAESGDEDEDKIITLFYGDEELKFDDPRYFSFAQALPKIDEFDAIDVIGWNGCQDISWEELQTMLDTLIKLGVLQRV